MPSRKPLVTLRVTPEQRILLHKAAERQGVSFQRWAMQILEQAARAA